MAVLPVNESTDGRQVLKVAVTTTPGLESAARISSSDPPRETTSHCEEAEVSSVGRVAGGCRLCGGSGDRYRADALSGHQLRRGFPQAHWPLRPAPLDSSRWCAARTLVGLTSHAVERRHAAAGGEAHPRRGGVAPHDQRRCGECGRCRFRTAAADAPAVSLRAWCALDRGRILDVAQLQVGSADGAQEVVIIPLAAGERRSAAGVGIHVCAPERLMVSAAGAPNPCATSSRGARLLSQNRKEDIDTASGASVRVVRPASSAEHLRGLRIRRAAGAPETIIGAARRAALHRGRGRRRRMGGRVSAGAGHRAADGVAGATGADGAGPRRRRGRHGNRTAALAERLRDPNRPVVLSIRLRSTGTQTKRHAPFARAERSNSHARGRSSADCSIASCCRAPPLPSSTIRCPSSPFRTVPAPRIRSSPSVIAIRRSRSPATTSAARQAPRS